MHKNAMKCNETLSKWCKNKHGASKIIDTFETYQCGVGEEGRRMGSRCGRGKYLDVTVMASIYQRRCLGIT
jgi:hypothetical protein